MAELDVSKALTGKRLLFTGCTGFVGKVTLSMLLHRYGQELERVYVLVRKGSASSAERRFFDKVASSEPFQPLRDSLGEDGAQALLARKVQVLDGDVTDPLAGLSEAEVQRLKGQVDGIIHCAGLVSFNPSLEVGLDVNTHGTAHVVDLALAWGAPLVHMSTSFVAGNRSGLVFEDEEVRGFFPKRDELDGRDFSLEQELQDCAKLVSRLREQADDKALTSDFRKRAMERLEAEGRDARDEKTLRLAVGRERKLWLTGELVRAGMERAHHWGWPNTYTYTKSLGEQVMAGTKGLRYAIVRPSIVESALRYPFPGWNEGFTTSAPLAFAGLKGQRGLPAGDNVILDLVPVDLVAGAVIGITAHTLEVEERRVYQLASGDVNPFLASRSVELVGLYRRRHYRTRDTGSGLLNELRSRLEPQPLGKQAFQLLSTPMFLKGARLLRETLEEVKPGWGAPRLQAVLEEAKGTLAELEDQAQSLSGLVDLFMPFLFDNRYVFRCDNTRSVYARMREEDRKRIPWDPEALDWRHYFLNVHMPGLEKWVFPGLEEETQKRKTVGAHRDLLELLDAAVHAFRHRVAFRMVEGERQERLTYGEVHRYAARVGSFLLKEGIRPQERVMLLSENRPEWGTAYFGILRAGAVVVPVDPALGEEEVANVARRAEARVLLVSDTQATSMPGLEQALRAAGVTTRLFSLADAMGGDPGFPDRIGPVKRSAAPDDLASLIFTSGTTGTPKGVMLTHRNFASLVAKLASTFDIGEGDGLLSVLPLHHTFEFSCGFLTPFSLGAEVTYIDELTADRLGEVLEEGRITAMIGVPALWQLLHRRITQEMASRPPLVEHALKGLMAAHGELRNRSALNLGKLLFWPVHRRFGGKLRLLVSGGSALPDEVHGAFHALGFRITEGYGLTEAAPVLAVSALDNKRTPGTVGPPLPGVELRIHEPDAEGIGEVIARGPNVMAGYFQDREATDAVLKDGWLHTGDLGRLDDEGRLFLVGRKKDVIIDANGKNVYPDELEELYGDHPHIQELSIVGLPDDAGGEKIACLCVSDSRGRPREDVRRELEEHFRKVSSELPFYKRVKLLRFRDGELERTSTRKVKRKAVVEELKRLERAAQSGERARQAVTAHGGVLDWLLPLVADVVQKPLSDVRPESRLAVDLGMDSLMLTELSVALEQAGVSLPTVEDLSQVDTVDDLRRLIQASDRRASAQVRVKELRDDTTDRNGEIEVPDAVGSVGRSVIGFAQKVLYGGVFQVKTTGMAYVPANRNFLVVANHTSHLDMGLVKTVLGEHGQRLTALAARDYFFDTPLKRAYFENFTRLIPMDRHGNLRESLRLAGEALRQGYHLLIFPEGTRSVTGELQEFKPTLGYLALTFGVDVLPLYIHGAFEALPKGAILPKRTDLEVRIGPTLEVDELRRRTRGMARSESYRHVTQLTEDAVKALREGAVLTLERTREVNEVADFPEPEVQRRPSGGKR